MPMQYDPATKTWKEVGSNSSSSSTPASKPASSLSSKPSSSSTPSSRSSGSYGSSTPSTKGSNTQVQSTQTAQKEQAYIEYNTLTGTLVLKASVGLLKIKQNTTIEVKGIGEYLSGKYFVSEVAYTLNASNGFSMQCTLIKTGFGSSLKAKPEVEDSVSEESVTPATPTYQKGDKVKIVGDNATYANAASGVKVPNWVKQKTHTIMQVSSDGERVLLQEIFSWTYAKFIEKV